MTCRCRILSFSRSNVASRASASFSSAAIAAIRPGGHSAARLAIEREMAWRIKLPEPNDPSCRLLMVFDPVHLLSIPFRATAGAAPPRKARTNPQGMLRRCATHRAVRTLAPIAIAVCTELHTMASGQRLRRPRSEIRARRENRERSAVGAACAVGVDLGLVVQDHVQQGIMDF